MMSGKAGSPWSKEENLLAVGDYFGMLVKELDGEKYSKKSYWKETIKELPERTRSGLELKYMNITAILQDLGNVWIKGYKPKVNYQALLKEVVMEYLNNNPELGKRLMTKPEGASEDEADGEGGEGLPPAPPSTPADPQNQFLEQLLKYGREGDKNISSPKTWDSEPDLFVDTQVGEWMKVHARQFYNKGDEEPGNWIFLIGAPGNGKSEAVGEFVREYKLLHVDDGKAEPEVDHDGEGEVPYLVTYGDKVNKHVRILQDCSVSKGLNSNPIEDLVGQLEEAMKDPNEFLIICANRGILNSVRRMVNGGKLENVIEHAVSKSSEKVEEMPDPYKCDILASGKIKGSPTIGARNTYIWPLDHESLLFGDAFDSNVGSVVDKLVGKITDKKNWDVCGDCSAREYCPFYQDREWLANPELRKKLLEVLRRRELVTGKRMVFRDVLGLLSYVVAGHVGDYGDKHPCEWAQEKSYQVKPAVDTNTWNQSSVKALLEILSRRVYMDLFSPEAPYGLKKDEPATGDLEKEKDAIEKLKHLVEAVVNKKTERLIGGEHVVQDLCQELDPINTTVKELGIDLDSKVSDQKKKVEEILNDVGSSLSLIEDAFFEYANDIENELLEESKDKNLEVPVLFSGLSRWLTAYTARLVGLAKAITPLSDEVKILERACMDSLIRLEYQEEEFEMYELPERLLGTKLTLEAGKGLEVRSDSKIRALIVQPRERNDEKWPGSDSLRIELSVGTGADPFEIKVTGRMVIGFLRKYILKIDPECDTETIDTIERLKSRLASTQRLTKDSILDGNFQPKDGGPDIFKIKVRSGVLTLERNND